MSEEKFWRKEVVSAHLFIRKTLPSSIRMLKTTLFSLAEKEGHSIEATREALTELRLLDVVGAKPTFDGSDNDWLWRL